MQLYTILIKLERLEMVLSTSHYIKHRINSVSELQGHVMTLNEIMWLHSIWTTRCKNVISLFYTTYCNPIIGI